MPAAVTALLFLPAPLMSQTSLTIYNDGRVLMRRPVEVAIPKGTSEHRLALGQLEPASVFSLDPDVAIVRSEYDGDLGQARALRRMVGRTLTAERPRVGGGYETIEVQVVGVDPLRFRMPDGTIAFDTPGALRFPADVVSAEPVLHATVRSGAARKGLPLGWFTDGAAWRAAYEVVLGARQQARVTGSAVVESRSLAVTDAQVQLLAGNVARARVDAGMKRREMMAMEARVAAAPPADYAAEERTGEFHLYTLPGAVTLSPGTVTTVALFEPATAAYEKRLVVRGGIPLWGFVPQQPEEQPVPVEVSYQLARPRGSAFGDTPVPGGMARVFEADRDGRLQLVGEASVRHTAAGEPLLLAAGEAFDHTARRTQTDYVTTPEKVKGVTRTVALVTWKVELANATDTAVTVDVREERGGEWSVVSSSVPAEKLSAMVTRFRVPVPARGRAELTYQLRAVW